MRPRVWVWLVGVLLVALMASSGCRKPRRHVLSKKQIQAIQAATLDEVPAIGTVISAQFDGAVELVGVDLPAGDVKAGKPVEVTWYWRSLKEVTDEWMIFVHVESGGRRSTHDHHAVGELHPIQRWKAGELIADRQKITLPGDFPDGPARVRVGIFDEGAWRDRRQNRRMAVTNPDLVTVKADDDGRVDVGALNVKGSGDKDSGKSAKSPRAYEALRTPTPPTLDGKLTDPGWRGVKSSRAFVSPHGKALPSTRGTYGRVMWDDEHLFVAMTCRDNDIYNDQTGRDATLWKQDVVEIYLDPGADGKDYVELQISPSGELFDAWFTSRRRPEWPKAAKALHMDGLKAAIHANGSVNVRDDDVADRSWTAEVAIPWKELPGVSGPPGEGQSWGFNLYRIDVAGPKGKGMMAAWAPAGGDFHNTADFGKLTFKKAQPPKPPSPPAGEPKATSKPPSPKGAKP